MKLNKKFLATSLLSFATSVVMANPFSDVPTGHWAYEAINSLSENGIVTGYPGNLFKGDQVVNRYHLAMIISKALAKLEQDGVNGVQPAITRNDIKTLEKLTVEFADELALLGVKTVALEKDLADIKKDVSNLKNDVESLKTSQTPSNRVRINGEAIVRHEDQLKGGPANVRGQVTSMALRFLFNIKIDDKVDAVVQPMFYADDLGTNLGGAAGTTMSYYRVPAQNRQADVYNAYVSIKDVLDGKLVLGRSFYTHGSNLIMDGYVDAIRYSRKVGEGNLAVNAIYRDVDRMADGTNSPNSRYDKLIWNLNYDFACKGHNMYFGYYTQDYIYDENSTRSLIEIGSKGKITKDNKFSYDLGLVFSEIDDFMGGDDMDGTLGYLAVKYDDGKNWAFKLAYASGDDEYISPNRFTFGGGKYLFARKDMRTFDGPETPFDDICYLRSNLSMQDANLAKVQIEYRPNSKSNIRVAYDMYSQDQNNKGVAADDEANVLTVEYKYQLTKSTKLRIGYYSLEGDKASDGVEDDALYLELYSRF